MRREEDSVGVIAADSATLTAQYDQVVVVEPAEIIKPSSLG
jgi:hypothetical protein